MKKVSSHATIQDRRLRHLGDAYLCVQKYNPPEVGAAEASSPRDRATEKIKNAQTVHYESLVWFIPGNPRAYALPRQEKRGRH